MSFELQPTEAFPSLRVHRLASAQWIADAAKRRGIRGSIRNQGPDGLLVQLGCSTEQRDDLREEFNTRPRT
jgi:phage replication-related protein YjqB (UPF0714/DUF867 family)